MGEKKEQQIEANNTTWLETHSTIQHHRNMNWICFDSLFYHFAYCRSKHMFVGNLVCLLGTLDGNNSKNGQCFLAKEKTKHPKILDWQFTKCLIFVVVVVDVVIVVVECSSTKHMRLQILRRYPFHVHQRHPDCYTFHPRMLAGQNGAQEGNDCCSIFSF